MGKVNSHRKGKMWENTNISKLSFSGNFYLNQTSMQFPKYGKKWVAIIREKYRKTETF